MGIGMSVHAAAEERTTAALALYTDHRVLMTDIPLAVLAVEPPEDTVADLESVAHRLGQRSCGGFFGVGSPGDYRRHRCTTLSPRRKRILFYPVRRRGAGRCSRGPARLVAAVEASAAVRSRGLRFDQKPSQDTRFLSARFTVAKRFSGDTRCPVMADLIKQSELKDRMKKIPEWELEKNQIERTFEFDDFVDAIDFVDRVAEVAEEEEHHPDIDIRYNKVRLAVSTHSKGGLTELDFNLAERIDTLEE